MTASEPMTGTLPSLWRVRMVNEEGQTSTHLVVARHRAEINYVLVDRGYEHLIRNVERLGTVPFGPGVVA